MSSCAYDRDGRESLQSRPGHSGGGRTLAGEGKEERRAAVHLAVRPDTAAVPLDDALRQGQPDAGALELVGAMQPLKHAEQLVDVAHVEPHPVVPHEVDDRLSLAPRPDLDLRIGTAASELEGVADQVREHLA